MSHKAIQFTDQNKGEIGWVYVKMLDKDYAEIYNKEADLSLDYLISGFIIIEEKTADEYNTNCFDI